MPLVKYDVVKLLVISPEEVLVKGLIGTIIEIYTKPFLGYEVEFTTEDVD